MPVTTPVLQRDRRTIAIPPQYDRLALDGLGQGNVRLKGACPAGRVPSVADKGGGHVTIALVHNHAAIDDDGLAGDEVRCR